jgi:hypothetical protein
LPLHRVRDVVEVLLDELVLLFRADHADRAAHRVDDDIGARIAALQRSRGFEAGRKSVAHEVGSARTRARYGLGALQRLFARGALLFGET